MGIGIRIGIADWDIGGMDRGLRVGIRIRNWLGLRVEDWAWD